MIIAKETLSKLRKSYSMTSKAKLLIKFSGSNKKYPLNGMYYGTLQDGTSCVAVHNQLETSTLLVVDFIKCLMTNNNLWNETSVMVYDNSVECNPIIDIQMTASSVTFVVGDLFKDIVRMHY